MKLHNKGWGYTTIHRHLIENGFEIGKSRTTVDSIIKKIKKRKEFLSQPVIDKIGNFRIMMMKIKYNLP
jgi:cobalamin biosynthesis Co2+ chelatase CbiK